MTSHGERAPLDLTRVRILAFRSRDGALDRRLPPGPESLRQATWAGLRVSMPRAALKFDEPTVLRVLSEQEVALRRAEPLDIVTRLERQSLPATAAALRRARRWC